MITVDTPDGRNGQSRLGAFNVVTWFPPTQDTPADGSWMLYEPATRDNIGRVDWAPRKMTFE